MHMRCPLKYADVRNSYIYIYISISIIYTFVPSHMKGYAYPQLYRTVHKDLFAKATAKLMKMSGMTLANVIGVTPSNESLAHLAAQPEVESLVYFTFGVASQGYAGLHGNVAYINNKPVIGLRKNLWSGDPSSKDKLEPAGLVKQLQQLPKDPSDPQSYVMGNYTCTPHISRPVFYLAHSRSLD